MKNRSPYNVVSRASFETAVKSGAAPSDAVLRKQVAAGFVKAEKADGGGGTPQRVFIISTDTVDRDNDIISMKGWQLDNYRKNPVVLWAHDYSQLPVGKCTGLKVVGNKLMATAEFADHDMAKTVLRLVDGGFLNSTSVGFRPVKFAINEDRHGIDFSEQELLEFSIVPVPANPEALVAASTGTADAQLLKQWADEIYVALKEDNEVVAECDSCKQPVNSEPGDGCGNPEGHDVEKRRRGRKDDGDEKNEGEQPSGQSAECPECHQPMNAAPGSGCLHPNAHEVRKTVVKRGRVISRANEERLKSAREHLNAVIAQVEEQIEEVEDELEASDKTKDFVFTLDDEDALDISDITADDVGDAFRDAVSQSVREIVRQETTAALNRARGRVD